jgi:hypothetical protein
MVVVFHDSVGPRNGVKNSRVEVRADSSKEGEEYVIETEGKSKYTAASDLHPGGRDFSKETGA